MTRHYIFRAETKSVLQQKCMNPGRIVGTMSWYKLNLLSGKSELFNEEIIMTERKEGRGKYNKNM